MGAAPTEQPGDDRGKGELLEDPIRYRRDLAIIQRAINEQWDIPPEVLSSLPGKLGKILEEDSKLETRDTVRIAQTLDRMVRTNQRAASLAVRQAGAEEGYKPAQPSPAELHKHEHVHLEGAAAPPSPEAIQVELVDDWYGTPDDPILDDEPDGNGELVKPPGKGTMKKTGDNGSPDSETKGGHDENES